MLAGNFGDISDFWAIASVTVTSDATTVTFADIPSTFTHLQIRSFARGDRTGAVDSGNLRIRFNSDSTSTYPMHCIEGNGSTASATAVTNETGGWAAFALAVSSHTTNVMGIGIIDILDYTNINKNKTIRALAGVDSNGTGSIGMSSSLWQNTSVITSITLTNRESTNIISPSDFALYGIKVKV